MFSVVCFYKVLQILNDALVADSRLTFAIKHHDADFVFDVCGNKLDSMRRNFSLAQRGAD